MDLLKFIEDQPRKFDEIKKTFRSKIRDRTLYNYLKELKDDGKIENPEKGLYVASGSQQIIFENEGDVKRALNHSKKLSHSAVSPGVWIRHMMMGPPYLSERDNDNFERHLQCLMDHLKTGYYRDFWKTLEKYRKITREYGFPIISNSFKITTPIGIFDDTVFRCTCIENGNYWFIICEHDLKPVVAKLPPIVHNELKNNALSTQRPASILIPENIVNQVKNYQRILLTQLYALKEQVEDGIPIKGSCKLCPANHIKILNKSTSPSYASPR